MPERHILGWQFLLPYMSQEHTLELTRNQSHFLMASQPAESCLPTVNLSTPNIRGKDTLGDFKGLRAEGDYEAIIGSFLPFQTQSQYDVTLAHIALLSRTLLTD